MSDAIPSAPVSNTIESTPPLEVEQPKKKFFNRLWVRVLLVVGGVLFVAFLLRPQDPKLLNLLETVQTVVQLVSTEPKNGKCHLVEFDASAIPPEIAEEFGKVTSKIEGLRIRIVRGSNRQFRFEFSSRKLGTAALGQSERPWIQSMEGVTFVGDETIQDAGLDYDLPFVRKDVIRKMTAALIGVRLLKFWGSLPVSIKEKDWKLIEIIISVIRVNANADVSDFSFEPNEDTETKTVATTDIYRQWGGLINLGIDRVTPPGITWISPGKIKNKSEERIIVARASNQHGILTEQCGRSIIFLEGTPEQMGAAQGELMKESIGHLVERGLYGLGGVSSIHTGKWFYEMFEEIERRTAPHIPERFLREVDAVTEAAGVSKRDGRYMTLLPELFHCSGVAVRGKATKDGRVYHARVLDYMNDVLLQNESCVQVFMPEGKYRWVSFGYGGFVGSVTAMNEKGLAIGELGGAGVGEWDGLPMCFLIREIMENAATVDEAVELIRNSKLTCVYYYVLSDAGKNIIALKCSSQEVVELKPGQQHPELPKVPEDTVFISGDTRAVELSKRLQKHYGNIDAQLLTEIIKQPVAKKANLHNAIFIPESREIMVSDAGNGVTVIPACDMPYQTLRLDELFQYYQANINK